MAKYRYTYKKSEKEGTVISIASYAVFLENPFKLRLTILFRCNLAFKCTKLYRYVSYFYIKNDTKNVYSRIYFINSHIGIVNENTNSK